MDRMVRHYSCKRKCRRWQFEVFMNLMDIAGTNASNIFRQSDNQITNWRRQFLKATRYQLIEEHIHQRVNQGTKYLKAPTIRALTLCGYEIPNTSVLTLRPGKKRCFLCPQNKDKKTNFRCSACKSFMCIRSSLIFDEK